MQTVLIVAQSVDGFITRHGKSGAEWTSPADKKWFREALEGFDCQVMARVTYETARKKILASTNDGPFRMVMTRAPQHHTGDSVEGRLEFSSGPPSEILSRMQALGCEACAILGGASAHDAFLAAGLVDELWITIEPRFFGTGTPVVNAQQDQTLELVEFTRLPNSDSMLLKYRVRR